MATHIKKTLILVLCLITVFSGCSSLVEPPVTTPDVVEVSESAAPELTAQPTGTPAPELTDPAATPEPTPEVTPEPTEALPTVDPNFPYMLYVEKGSFTLTIFGIGETGQYTEVVAQYRISHGGNRTPAGNYVLANSRERWHPFAGGDHGYAQYAVMFCTAAQPDRWTGLYIHGPMYREENPNALWPRYYDGSEYGIGGENTQGCLRMVVEAAKFIFENCPKGTQLVIVNGSPLGTTSPEPPDREGLYHDPTDPDALAKP